MRTAANVIDNGKLTVTVNANGTLNVLDKDSGKLYESLLMLEDCADVGEGWNYVKPAFDEEIISVCGAAQYAVLSDCPEFFACKITAQMRLPAKSDGETRSADAAVCLVESVIKLFKNSKKISVCTNVDNKQVNHRLRVIFPTGFKTDKFITLLPFDMYEWNIAKKDWSKAKEVDTLVNPNQGVVSISDGENMFSIYNKGLYEVGVPDRPDRAVYLTLFRSFTNETGMPEGDMGKMLNRKIRLEYALDFGQAAPGALVKNANAFKVGLSSFETPLGNKSLPASDRFIKISGGAVLSSLRANQSIGGDIFNTLRLYDVDGGTGGAGATGGTVTFKENISELYEVNLAENKIIAKLKPVKNSFSYSLKAKQIKTYAFKF
jgi:alpha-mannosidase/mannosylglycerate hydrolase